MAHHGGMKLAAYLHMKKMSDAEFGRIINRDRSLVSRYRNGHVTPPLAVIAAIEDATDRAVSFRDFVDSMRAAS